MSTTPTTKRSREGFRAARVFVCAALLAAAPAAASPGDGSGSAAPPQKTQPAALKLKLGHYKNVAAGIGVTIDLSEDIHNVAKIVPAKIKFDGETRVWRLTGTHGGGDRIDYARDAKDGGGVMLQVWKDGRRSVYVPDPDSDKWSPELVLTRDGDSDPL